jgi:hypothetical protein
MAQAANIRAAKLKSASFVSDEFDGGRRSLLDLLIDVKLVQLESVIMVCGG